MRRYFYEVKANTFVGTISAKVRDLIWNDIVTLGVQASMVVHTNNEQGFIYKTTKEDTNYCFEDFDGITLPTSFDTSLKLWELYAKPDYRLIDHILDVGYVAEALMRYGRAFNMVKIISEKTDIPFDVCVNSISWLCALHDIGKAHPYFISKMYSNSENLSDIYESLKERNLTKDGDFSGFRHERYSRTILKNYFIKNEYPKESVKFANLVAYHHQGKSFNDFTDSIVLDDVHYTNIHTQIIDIINKEWSFDKEFSKNYLNGMMYSILSIMVTADWIASGKKWRDLLYSDKRECARQFIKDNELSYIPMSERFKDLHWDNVFDFKPNALQEKILEIAKDKPQLMIVEYPCGGGKTEASLVSSILMGSEKSGIYIATPTMSTAKGMTNRMNDLSKKAGLGLNIPEFDTSAVWSENDMIKIPKSLWVAKTRHKMLYPFAVGTVDQIIKTMLYTRYECISLMGLSDKVLVIDEVHAYDSYMLAELKMLLKWSKYLNIPVILLSATLPTITKNELLEAYGCSKDELPTSKEYPLITTYGDNGCNCTPVSCEGKKFKIEIIETDNVINTWNDIFSRDYKGCNAYIESTVDRTWELFKMANSYKDKVMMFNGRDTLSNKEDKTLRLIDELGKNRVNRPDNITLTATSIIEQSLDIDLDRMFTYVAPIDLLIQRFGRVWRHSDVGTIRENESVYNPITIIIPTNHNTLPTYIYNREVLENTIDVLKNMTEIDTVRDARWLIDTVYNSEEWINDVRQIMRASKRTIESPTETNMLINRNENYVLFNTNRPVTRDADYPTVQMAIVDKDDVIDVDYTKVKDIMLNKTIVIAEKKIEDLRGRGIEPLETPHDWLKDVYLFDKDMLLNLGIELTGDGLKWYNN